MNLPTEKAIFAAGCFWSVQEEFDNLPGVVTTKTGYTGGHLKNPKYEEVCTGKTGHAEAVEVIFDPKIISYEKLLEVFWNSHDPTQLNRQGPDIGTQYRSAIFYTTPHQKEIAEKSLKEEEKNLGKKIATEITPAGDFFMAEEYHQQYNEKNRRSCKI